MGYRSEITVLFYAQGEDEWPLLKLFFAENFPKDLAECLEEIHHGNKSGFVFRVWDYKWYDSYPEVQAFNEFENMFKNLGKCADVDGAWSYEFARIGEDYNDIEHRNSDNAHYVLNIKRYAEIDF